MPTEAEQAPMLQGGADEMPRVFAVQIRVGDLARSERFYSEAFGARIHNIHERESAVQFPSGPGIILVHAAQEDGAATPGGPGGFIVQVADIESAVARIADAGGAVDRPPNSGTDPLSFGVRAALIRDPDGVRIELIQRGSQSP